MQRADEQERIAKDRADLALIAASAWAAAKAALEMQSRARNSARRKDDGSLVTDADLAANDMLRAELVAERPDYGWLSEEDEDVEPRGDAARWFAVDPIDGTARFANGDPNWAVSVGVVVDGAPWLGAVAAPGLNALFVGGVGLPATLNGAPIRITNRARLIGAGVIVRRKPRDLDLWRTPPPPFASRPCPPMALRLCRVADGSADALISAAPTHVWDVAAGAAIARAAGGVVEDWTGVPYRWRPGERRALGPLASGPALAAVMRARMRPAPTPAE